MNKLCSALVLLAVCFLTSCAVSEEEKEADIQRHKDSIAAAEAMIRAAQLATESRANALGQINNEALKNDSLIKRDSILKFGRDTNIVTVKDTTADKKTTVIKSTAKPAEKKEAPKATNKKDPVKTPKPSVNGTKKK